MNISMLEVDGRLNPAINTWFDQASEPHSEGWLVLDRSRFNRVSARLLPDAGWERVGVVHWVRGDGRLEVKFTGAGRDAFQTSLVHVAFVVGTVPDDEYAEIKLRLNTLNGHTPRPSPKAKPNLDVTGEDVAGLPARRQAIRQASGEELIVEIGRRAGLEPNEALDQARLAKHHPERIACLEGLLRDVIAAGLESPELLTRIGDALPDAPRPTSGHATAAMVDNELHVSVAWEASEVSEDAYAECRRATQVEFSTLPPQFNTGGPVTSTEPVDVGSPGYLVSAKALAASVLRGWAAREHAREQKADLVQFYLDRIAYLEGLLRRVQ